jgi:D-3-phosphoglycerate dehydrogenase
MKILIASSIDDDAIETLRQRHDVICAFDASQEQLETLVVDREVLIFRSGVQINRAVMSRAPQLKLLVRAGSGLDNIDMDYVREQRLQLVRVPGPGAQAVAEMTFALMLSLARKILPADRQWRQGHWVKRQMKGHSVSGKVLGVVGAGNIGSRVGQMGAAWGMKALGCVEMPTEQKARELADAGVKLVEFEQVLQEADFITLHVPLKETTRNLIDAQALSLVKPTAFLINLARGGVVDEAALYDALVENRLRGAALDVHAREGEGNISPFAELDNVILTPHIGASSYDAQREIGEIVIRTVNGFAENGQLHVDGHQAMVMPAGLVPVQV